MHVLCKEIFRYFKQELLHECHYPNSDQESSFQLILSNAQGAGFANMLAQWKKVKRFGIPSVQEYGLFECHHYSILHLLAGFVKMQNV